MSAHIDFSRLHDKFNQLVNDYMERDKLTQEDFAKYIGVQRTHLCLVLNKNSQRKLTKVMIERCILKGVFSVENIYDENPSSDEESKFWDEIKVLSDKEFRNYLHLIRKKGRLDALKATMKALSSD